MIFYKKDQLVKYVNENIKFCIKTYMLHSLWMISESKIHNLNKSRNEVAPLYYSIKYRPTTIKNFDEIVNETV